MAEVGETAPLVLILGGSRSGKSAVAERLVDQLADGAAVTYVATALLSGICHLMLETTVWPANAAVSSQTRRSK